MVTEPFFSWREPIVASWREEIAGLNEGLKGASGLSTDQAARLRRLAAMRLGDGERLWLRRLVKRTQSLAEPLPGFRRFRLLLVSNRVTSFLASDLEAAGVARGLLIETIETDYDVVRSLALTRPAQAMEAPLDGGIDAVLLLLDTAFFQSDGPLLDAAWEAQSTGAMGAQLNAIVGGLRTRFRAGVVVATVAAPPELQQSSADLAMAGTAARLVQEINQAIATFAEARLAILFDLAALAARIGTMTFFDPVRLHQAKVPFSMDASSIVADSLAALVAAMCGRSARALVLDLDNTLWGGVVADDGLEGIVVGQGSPDGEAFQEVQRYALELQRRGIILAVVSKNQEEVAREPFRSHPDMLLREEHLAILLANFDDKATNIARAARMLNLDPSALVFLDDNPAERERVRAALPWVMVPEPGEDPAEFVRSLSACGFFEQLPLTPEDLGRATAYRGRADAKALQEKIGDYEAYLASLDMELTISPFDRIGRARITQLIQKSNQFNLTTRRYSEAEVAAFEQDAGYLCWQVRLNDRFADHGMISVMVVAKDGSVWAIDSWVMSCRVLERGVEATVVSELARLAASEGAQALTAVYLPTARNLLVNDLYDRLGFDRVSTAADGTRAYRLELDAATHQDGPIKVSFK